MCLVNGAKEGHGIQTSGTGTADYIPACHRTSLTTETEGGERVSQLCPATESRDPPASSPGSRATDVFTVFDNLSPTSCPNVWRKTTGGWSEGRTGQHIRPMAFRERTVYLPALILRKEGRCRLDCGIPFSRDTTTIESSQLSPTQSTSKNCVRHATHGETKWHSIQKGCRRSQHSAKVQTRSSRLRQLAIAFESDRLGRLVSCDPPDGIISMTLAISSTTILQIFN